MRLLLRCWIAAFALMPTLAAAQSLEGVLAPGEVIKGHAKWEDDCRSCHVPFDRAAQTKRCTDCHKEIGADLRGQKRFHGRLKDSTCRTCHTEHKGRDARITVLDRQKFDHDQTDYPLKGGHRLVAAKCDSCHRPGAKFREAPHQCLACHKKDDVHKGKLGAKCEECHSVEKWKLPDFDHDKTKFKLEGGHVKTKCKECHRDQAYKDTPRECVACHKKDDDKDGHEGHFGKKCETCHNAKKWDDSLFDHGRDGKYVLKGKHDDADCVACHEQPLYTIKLPTRCVACHKKDDGEKGHKGALGEKCESCHNEKSWKGATFDHDRDSDYPLTGKHKDVKCNACHKAGVTASAGKPREKAPRECIGCHRPDDEKKGHKGRYGEKCETCHTTKDWKDITFRHDRDTKYPLRDKHALAKCDACHSGPLYKEKTPTDCYACHRKDDDKKGHKGTLGKQCDACHNVKGWRVDAFDHNKSRFPLIGGHVRVECKKCHTTVAFKDAPRECNGCHEKDDVHKKRLGVDCQTCHNSRIWKSWDFNHGKTAFPLAGAHQKLQCYTCHKAPMQKRKGPPVKPGCFDCHAKDDVHKGAFSLRCDECHGENAWLPVRQR
jgi:hypothetical protein